MDWSDFFSGLILVLPLSLFMILKGGKARREGGGSENAHDFVTSPSNSGLYYYGWYVLIAFILVSLGFEGC